MSESQIPPHMIVSEPADGLSGTLDRFVAPLSGFYSFSKSLASETPERLVIELTQFDGDWLDIAELRRNVGHVVSVSGPTPFLARLLDVEEVDDPACKAARLTVEKLAPVADHG